MVTAAHHVVQSQGREVELRMHVKTCVLEPATTSKTEATEEYGGDAERGRAGGGVPPSWSLVDVAAELRRRP